ncbi:MAG TPA: MFS transporter [Acidimicrobiia bacterium]|nr:MFS transporter [Acidimicrobiia bacterium]
MRSLLNPRFVSAWMVSLLAGLSYFLFVHFPRFLESLGASEVEIGLIVGSTALSAIAVRPHLGRDLDRRGRRPILLLGGLVNVIVLALYPTVGSLGLWLYAIRIGQGFGVALSFTAIFTYAADLVPADKRTQGLALFGVSGLLPIALGGVLGDFVLARWSFDGLFYTSLALGALALALSFTLPESSTPVGRRGEVSFLRPLLQRDLLPLWWITVVFTLSLNAYFTFLRTFVDESGIGTVGGFFAAYAGTAIAVRIIGGWVPDRLGSKRVLYPSLVIFAAGFVVLATASTSLAVAVAGGLCGFGHAYVFPILYAMSFGRAQTTDRGSASAIFTGLFDIGTLIGGPVLGTLITWFGYSAMFLVAAGWVVAGSIVFSLWEGDAGPRRRTRTTRVSLG